jgi:hypothetical protein
VGKPKCNLISLLKTSVHILNCDNEKLLFLMNLMNLSNISAVADIDLAICVANPLTQTSFFKSSLSATDAKSRAFEVQEEVILFTKFDMPLGQWLD